MRKGMAPAAVIALGVVLGVLTISSDGRGPDRRAEPARASKKPNVVMLIFDEFPGDSLLGPRGRIDAQRYPNFASLARDGYWFRNAFSSYDSTPKAVPLIMDGHRPDPNHRADPSGHPRTLFDLFGRSGYLKGDSREWFSLIVPENSLRPGRNRVDLLQVRAGGRLLRLASGP